jgi:hypothetical protein
MQRNCAAGHGDAIETQLQGEDYDEHNSWRMCCSGARSAEPQWQGALSRGNMYRRFCCSVSVIESITLSTLFSLLRARSSNQTTVQPCKSGFL